MKNTEATKTKWNIWDDETDAWIVIEGEVVTFPNGERGLLTRTFRKDGEDRGEVYAEGFRGGHHNGQWMTVDLLDVTR